METAYNVITDALKEIAAIPAESGIDSDDAQLGILYLNNMMLDFSVNGINLGYTLVSSLGDEVTVDLAAVDGIVKNLALELSPLYFDNATSQLLFAQAQDGFKSLLDIAITRPAPAPYDSRLPVGSGNSDDISRQNFYNETLEPILTEGGGRVS